MRPDGLPVALELEPVAVHGCHGDLLTFRHPLHHRIGGARAAARVERSRHAVDGGADLLAAVRTAAVCAAVVVGRGVALPGPLVRDRNRCASGAGGAHGGHRRVGDPAGQPASPDADHPVGHIAGVGGQLGPALQIGDDRPRAAGGGPQRGVGGGIVGAAGGVGDVQDLGGAPLEVHAAALQPGGRVMGGAVKPGSLPDLQVQVRSGGGPGVAHQRDGLPGAHRLAGAHMRGGIPHVVVGRVVGLPVDPVLEHHVSGVVPVPAEGAHHCALGHRLDGRPLGGAQVLPQVIGGGALHGDAARTVGGSVGVGAGGQRQCEAAGAARGLDVHPVERAGTGRRHISARPGRNRRGSGRRRRRQLGVHRQGQAHGKSADDGRREFLRHSNILTSRPGRAGTAHHLSLKQRLDWGSGGSYTWMGSLRVRLAGV